MGSDHLHDCAKPITVVQFLSGSTLKRALLGLINCVVWILAFHLPWYVGCYHLEEPWQCLRVMEEDHFLRNPCYTSRHATTDPLGLWCAEQRM